MMVVINAVYCFEIEQMLKKSLYLDLSRLVTNH